MGEAKGGRPCVLRWKTLRVSSAPHSAGFESRHEAAKKPATEAVTGSKTRWCPQRDVRVRLRRPPPLRRFAPCVLRWKTLRVSAATHPAGFESRHKAAKKPATEAVTGSKTRWCPQRDSNP